MKKTNLKKTFIVLFLATLLVMGYSITQTTTASTIEDVEEYIGNAKNAAAHGSATFLEVEGYEPWAALVVNAGDPRGVDEVTISFEEEVLRIEATDGNSTNHVSILINKAFADEYLDESEGNIDISFSDAVNYEGIDKSNESAGHGAVYVFHIEHFSTQWIDMTAVPPNDFEPPVEGAQAFRNRAKNAAADGSATFLKVEGYEPWAALVVNAGDPRGVDLVTVSFEDGVLRIEATDSNSTNRAAILINRAFADEHLDDSEGNLDMSTSDAVNYQGLDNSNASAGHAAAYVFHIEHFSTQWIEIAAEEDGIPYPGIVFTGLGISIATIYYHKRRTR